MKLKTCPKVANSNQRLFANKPHILILASWLACLPRPFAQETIITERGAHHQRVETVTVRLDELGNSISETNSYVQLETGLNYVNEKGQWEESNPTFEIIPGG